MFLETYWTFSKVVFQNNVCAFSKQWSDFSKQMLSNFQKTFTFRNIFHFLKPNKKPAKKKSLATMTGSLQCTVLCSALVRCIGSSRYDGLAQSGVGRRNQLEPSTVEQSEGHWNQLRIGPLKKGINHIGVYVRLGLEPSTL